MVATNSTASHRPAKPQENKLPDYIVARNARARRAGLVLEQQTLKGDLLTTWYRGTEAQWRASGFLERPHMKFPDKSPNNGALTAFGFKFSCPPWVSGGLKKVSDTEFRGSFSNEEIPEHVQALGGGIVAYSTHDRMRDRSDACTLYVGPKTALIARGIAPAEIENNYWYRDPARYEDIVWQAGKLDDGRHYFYLNLDATERVNRTKTEGPELPFQKPSELIESFANRFWAYYQQARLEHAKVRTVGGETFYIDKDSLEEIDDAVREVYQAIVDARAFVQPRVSAEIARRTVKAKADSQFSRFMSFATASGYAEK